MSIDRITAAWDRADPTAIHPLRRVSEDAYWQSGEAQADQLATVLEPGCSVVDFGCGDGRVTIPLAARGYDVTGADASPNMLRRLRERAPHIPTVPSDGVDLPREMGDPVDAVVALAVLIHHDYASGRSIIHGLADTVRPGGTLILDWPTSDRPGERRDWIGVTTWSPAAQTALAHKLRLTRVDSALPWSVWTT